MRNTAVLLTVHNRKELTLQCLSCLFSQEVPEDTALQVYLTDDGCTDGTPEAIARQFPQVHIISGSGSLFWNRGMNAAWDAALAEAEYDSFLWLNDDTLLFPGALTRIFEADTLKGGQSIIVGATVSSSDHSVQTYGGRLEGGKFVALDGELRPARYFNGNIALIPLTVYRRLGQLDPYFSHSFGDFDYGRRAHSAGIAMYQVGQALGSCDAHVRTSDWCNPALPLATRWRAMYAPNGMPPHEIFHFSRRHQGFFRACRHYVSTIVHCLCPYLYNWLHK